MSILLPPNNTNQWPYGFWQPVYSAPATTNFIVNYNVINLTYKLVVWVHKKCAKANGAVAVWRHSKGDKHCYYCQKKLRGRKCGHPDSVEEGTPCSFYPDPPAKPLKRVA